MEHGITVAAELASYVTVSGYTLKENSRGLHG